MLRRKTHAKAGDRLQYAPIIEQCRECADRQHERQYLESEDKARAGRGLDERQGAAAEIAENKRRSPVGRLLQRQRRMIQQQQHMRSRWKAHQHYRERGLQPKTDNNGAPWNVPRMIAAPPLA
jgi:hypothetical protein